MDDQQLIARIRKGEVELFRELVERYHRPLLSFIHTITRDPFLTEEVGQTVFLAFFQALDGFDEKRETPVVAWLFVAARNQAINVLKKERRYVKGLSVFPEKADHRPGPPERLIRKEDEAILNDCLARLPEPYASTLKESLQGRTIQEIAAREMTLPGTVKSRLARARQKLGRLLRAKLEE